MFFPEQSNDLQFSAAPRLVFIYQNGKPDLNPVEVKLVKKKTTFKDIAKLLKFNNLRLYSSDGAQCYQQDLDFIKKEAVLYASRGQQFDPGSCYAEYEMTKLLGEGGFGKVYLARHKQTNENFAIKIIKTQNIGSVGDIDSIFVQAEILKSLKHPNIVKVHKCLTLRNMEVVIIMEYLQGGDLFKFLQKAKRLEEQVVRGIIRQIVKGMLYCHKNNLTHRDLKLQNLLLVNSEEKRIKIIDFGIAGVISSMKWEDLDTGSLGYMAPECFVNQKNHKFDGRIDVWSTGIILFAMLCGELPFKGSCISETIQTIKQGKFKLPSTIQKKLSEGCFDVLKRCLDINPKTRITMQELDDHPWISTDILTAQRHLFDDHIPTISEVDEEIKVEQKLKDIGNKQLPIAKNLKKSGSKISLNTPGKAKIGLKRDSEKEKQKKRFR